MVNIIYQTGEQSGEAYAFFNCGASKESIGRKFVRSSQLELSLEEVKGFEQKRETDPKLLEFIRQNKIGSHYPSKYRHLMATAQPTRIADLKYVIKARYHNHTNEETAVKLGADVLNEIYLAHDKGEIFTGAIIGKADDGEYGIWEDE